MSEFIQDDLRVFVVPVDILKADLTINEKMVYIVLRSFVNPHELQAFPSNRTIAELGSMSVRTVQRSIDNLIKKGLIQKSTRYEGTKQGKIRQTSNLYKLNNPMPESHTGGVRESHHEQNHVNKTNKNINNARERDKKRDNKNQQLERIKSVLKDKYKNDTGALPFSFIQDELINEGFSQKEIQENEKQIKSYLKAMISSSRKRKRL